MTTFTAQDNHRGRAVPITHSGAGVLAARGAFVAVATQVSGHLGPDRGLQQQPGTEHRDLLDRTRQVLAAGEHPINLCLQPLRRRYPLRHGRGFLPSDLLIFEGT